MTLRKGTRVARSNEPNQINDAIEAILNSTEKRGFAGLAPIGQDDEWAPGAYIESEVADDVEIIENVDVLLRRLASFYTRYAREVVEQRRAVAKGELSVSPYRSMITTSRINNAKAIPSEDGTAGACSIFFTA